MNAFERKGGQADGDVFRALRIGRAVPNPFALLNDDGLSGAHVDRALTESGWAVLDIPDANLDASRGVAIREFPLTSGYGFADYVLFDRLCGFAVTDFAASR